MVIYYHLSRVYFVNNYTREFLAVNFRHSLVTRLSLSSGVSFVEQIRGDVALSELMRKPRSILVYYQYAVRFVSHGKIVAWDLAAFNERCGSSTWGLQRRDVAGERP